MLLSIGAMERGVVGTQFRSNCWKALGDPQVTKKYRKTLSLPFLWLMAFWTKANTFYCQSLFWFRRHGENTHVFPVIRLFNIQLRLDGLINSIEQKCLCECFPWRMVGRILGVYTFEFKHYSTNGINQLKPHRLQLNKSLELFCHLPGLYNYSWQYPQSVWKETSSYHERRLNDTI